MEAESYFFVLTRLLLSLAIADFVLFLLLLLFIPSLAKSLSSLSDFVQTVLLPIANVLLLLAFAHSIRSRRRESEFLADTAALIYSTKAAIVKALERYSYKGYPGDEPLSSIFSTHPNPDERIAEINDLASTYQIT